jgi:hypothetical protein
MLTSQKMRKYFEAVFGVFRGVTENSRSAPVCAGLRRSAPVCAGLRRSAPVRAGLRRSTKNYFLPIIKFIMCFRYFVMLFIDYNKKKLF